MRHSQLEAHKAYLRIIGRKGMSNNYIVTGCAGFIGSRVSELLIEEGHRVTGIDDLSDGYDPRLKEWRLERLQAEEQFTFHKADIRDFKTMADVFASEEFDAILNLAARAGVRQSVEDPWIYAQTNYVAMVNLLELCREMGIGKVVQASTSSVYGDDTPAPFDESAPASKPLSPYAGSKKAAEDLCYTYHYLHGLDVTVFRFFTVYGPAGRPDMSVFKFVRAIAEGESLTLFGDGGERDFTHVDDVARGVVAGLRPLGHEIINLGGGKPATVGSIIEIIESVLGRKATIKVTDRPAADVDSTWADVSKAERLLGWRPEIELETGISGVVSWYLNNRSLARDLRG